MREWMSEGLWLWANSENKYCMYRIWPEIKEMQRVPYQSVAIWALEMNKFRSKAFKLLEKSSQCHTCMELEGEMSCHSRRTWSLCRKQGFIIVAAVSLQQGLAALTGHQSRAASLLNELNEQVVAAERCWGVSGILLNEHKRQLWGMTRNHAGEEPADWKLSMNPFVAWSLWATSHTTLIRLI